jgi:hypothetical protein
MLLLSIGKEGAKELEVSWIISKCLVKWRANELPGVSQARES